MPSLKDKVCSLEASICLKENGVLQESIYFWEKTIGGTDQYKIISPNNKRYALENKDKYLSIISAFTVEELDKKLTGEIIIAGVKQSFVLKKVSKDNYRVNAGNATVMQKGNEATIKAYMVIYSIELPRWERLKKTRKI